MACRSFLVVCTDAQPAAASCAAVDAASHSIASSQLMPELHALLLGFDDQVSEPLPEGLPPERSIGFAIPVEPGKCQPPCKACLQTLS